RVGDDVVAPKDIVRLDGDDPYLVVAADKGTASFSDIANEIADDYGFWLGDAFASGGSYGYDHKDMAITARGAWVNVRRHFREMGVDTQKDEISVIGIGDMSGDVFGNGMLLSKTIKLIGAFDHRHVFIDPDPDPEASFKERKRLFNEKRSTWEDYDPDLISEGGGVFSRQSKSISLSAKMKEILDTDKDKLAPNEVIHLLLKAQADLLWVGGIGTYVKSSEESHAAVGDRANDAIRVNGSDLRVKVIGEGGNLGLTQKGRIEFAQAGGRLNTDAVDNSGGVDCSDHEVNIKILLNRSVEEGDLTAKQRNKLLFEMTDDVAELVLADNYRQSGMISVTQARAPQLLEFQANFMRMMERDGSLNREVEALPDDEEISERLASGKGLTRPETAVLMGYAKLGLAARLLRSDVPDDPWLERTLKSYFPSRLHSDFEDQLQAHRLRRDIIANELANAVINHAGITYVTRVAEETGAPVDQIVRAYIVARQVFDLPDMWEQINDLDYEVDAGLQLDMMLGAKELLHRQATWFLTRIEQPLDLQDTIDRFCPGVRSLKEQLSECLPETVRARVVEKADSLCSRGVPRELAYSAACMEHLAAASDIVMVGDKTSHELPATARAYFRLGEEVGLAWMRSAADEVSVADHWERLATSAIRDEVFDVQRMLALKALDTEDYPKKALEDFLDAHSDKVRRCGELISEIRASGSLSLAKLGYVLRQTRALFDI
ncbi:MAG: NAD-glutamate dehydrogenase, partial [Alphaproteobacteria bacterium]|nr:NAD-glutamate dehydrogenase [Alphaproteobacteria bacterium]